MLADGVNGVGLTVANLKTAFEKVWKSADNAIGFSAIPSGRRAVNGTYSGAGSSFAMWTFVNDYEADQADLYEFNDGEDVSTVQVSKHVGASVRCIKKPAGKITP